VDLLYLRRRKTLIHNRGRRCSLSLFRQNRLGEGHSEIKPPSPRSEVGSGPIPQTIKSLLITETKDTMINIPDDCGYQVVGNMMRSSESLQEARGRITTRMDIMEPSPNASTEQKQLASSYQGLIKAPVTLCFLGAVYKYTYLLTYLLTGAKKKGEGEHTRSRVKNWGWPKMDELSELPIKHFWFYVHGFKIKGLCI